MKRVPHLLLGDWARGLGVGALLAFPLAAAPGLVAADFGGILPWTAWVSAIGLAMLAVSTLAVARLDVTRRRQLGSATAAQRLTAILLLLVGLGLFQLIPFPIGLLSWLGGGSYEAYTLWLEPFSEGGLARAPLSIDPALTQQAIWYLLQIVACVTLAAFWFSERRYLFVVLGTVAVSGLIHASLGIFQRLTEPNLTVWGVIGSSGGAPFGTFVNRSNAAVTLLLGLAASLGLLAWRLSAISVAGRSIHFRQLPDLIFDRLACVAVVASLGLVLGLLVCGSRSGLAGALGGLGLALILMQRIHKSRGVLVTLIALTVISVTVIASSNFSQTTLDRASNTIERSLETQQLHDARFDHWPDGWRTAWQQPLLGWGLGTYRYAYLPFQKSSSGGWFVHAENMWLELFVEAGLAGVGIVAACLSLLVLAIRKLGKSFDPVDHGLAVTGWFTLGSLAVSQFFDFGLTLHGNSLAAALLFGAVVGRAASIEVSSGGEAAELRSRSHSLRRAPFEQPVASVPLLAASARGWVPQWMFLVGAGLLAFASAWGFDRVARRDAAVRQAERVLLTWTRTPEQLEPTLSQIEKLVQSGNHDSRLLVELTALRLASDRHLAGQALPDSADIEQKREALRNLSSSSLRQLISLGQSDASATDRAALPPAIVTLHTWFGPAAGASFDRIGNGASAARGDARAAVQSSPFSSEARVAWINTLLTPTDLESAEQVLQQAATLRQRNPAVLVMLATRSAELGNTELGFRLWQQAIILNPSRTAPILRIASQQPGFRASRVLPPLAEAYSAAVSDRSSRPLLDRETLERSTQILVENLPEPPADRSARYQLVASVEQELGLLQEATVSLEKAINLQPRDANLRLRQAETLLSAKQFRQARDAARQGESIFAGDHRFKKMLDQIAKEIEQSAVQSDLP